MVLITDAAVNQTINKCHGRVCCGPVRYLLDECDGAIPWKCYYAVANVLGGTLGFARPPTGWSMAGGKMTLPTETVGVNTESKALMWKMKSYPPPWTLDYVIKFSDLTAFGGGNTEVRIWTLNNRLNIQGPVATNAFDITYAIGPTVPGYGTTRTVNGLYTGTNEIHVQISLDAALLFSVNVEIDGAVPGVASGSTLPFSRTINEATANAITAMTYWPISSKLRRLGWYDYIEAWVRPV